jgi:hypothetical protein
VRKEIEEENEGHMFTAKQNSFKRRRRNKISKRRIRGIKRRKREI